MATRLSIFVLVLVAVAACCEAQTTHVVGDDLGWTVPQGGASVYSTWASRRSFAVGDILVFNFASRAHDVAAVTKPAFNDCNDDSPISLSVTGPSNITLQTAGENFFICTIGDHCEGGQKLAINVTGTTVATPPPSPPFATPSPPSSSSMTLYTVGDMFGWTVGSDAANIYQNWTFHKTFMVGDILVFNFLNGTHDVAEVMTKSAFDSCDTSNSTCLGTAGPVNVTLTTVGEHFFTCSVPNHCTDGQKLLINVTEATTAPRPGPDSPIPPPTSTTTPPPPQSSSSSFVAAFPITLLSVVIALLL